MVVCYFAGRAEQGEEGECQPSRKSQRAGEENKGDMIPAFL